jgi:flavin reductase (DIM6/NTAB) family NADH-FMN oxidoreductase RutF
VREPYPEAVTIHSGHPFVPPEGERDPARRFRGRLGGAVSLWTTGSEGDRAGLTVSSLMVATGEPAHVLALLDPDSSLSEALEVTRTAVVCLLEWDHHVLADAFGGQFPAPGGPFRLADWAQTRWGPRLSTARTWAGVRRCDAPAAEVGWTRLVDCVIEHVEIGEEVSPLVHRRGRYRRPGA